MESFKGTKGKWEVTGVFKNEVSCEGGLICKPVIKGLIKRGGQKSSPIQKANALLISKAPEMLWMLNEIYKLQCVGEANDKHVRKRVLELIKEATEL